MLYDTHCHLNDKAFSGDLAAVIDNARRRGVKEMNVVGCDWQSCQDALAIAEKYEGIYASLGVHPHDAQSYCDDLEADFYELGKRKKVIALGEIGLDYHYDNCDREVQAVVFRRQIKVAQELDLPLVIHCRDAMADTLKILKEEGQKGGYRGVFHCYSGSYEDALTCLKMGFYIGIDGPITYPNARKLLEIGKKVPLERLLLETDCPYLTPQQFRGKRNEPAYLPFIAAKIAELRAISFDKVAESTSANARRLFHNK